MPNQVNAYYKSIKKSLQILKSFTNDETELSGSEIARRVGLHRATVYRILSVLEQEDFIERDGKTSKYSLGPGVYTLGSIYLNSKDLLVAARAIFKKLNELTDEVVSMAILDQGNAVIVMKEDSKAAIRYSRPIGQTFPAYSTAMGRALLSEFSDDEIDSLYPQDSFETLTSKSIKKKTELINIIHDIRKTGLSFNIGGSIEGLEGIAALVRDSHSKAVAAISFAVPTFRMDKSKRNNYAKLIQMAASLISYRLGYQNGSAVITNLPELESWWTKVILDSKM